MRTIHSNTQSNTHGNIQNVYCTRLHIMVIYHYYNMKARLKMKRKNGTGALFKLNGNRRKPWTIRITDGWVNGKQKYKYLAYFETKEEAEMTLNDFVVNGVFEIPEGEPSLHDTRLHRIWGAMIQRCGNPKNISYKWYGGKGVTVCDEWRYNFKSFYNWAMSNGYNDELTIDRINNDGNYEPSNCRWITIQEQQKNRGKK